MSGDNELKFAGYRVIGNILDHLEVKFHGFFKFFATENFLHPLADCRYEVSTGDEQSGKITAPRPERNLIQNLVPF